MAEVRLQGISKRFGDIAAVTALDLTVAEGDFVVLLGPTGAGKTTTLRLIAGLEAPDEGTVHISGTDMTREAPAGRDIAFVFQQYSLYPHLSVRENLAFPLKSPARRMQPAEIEARIGRVAETLRISEKLDNRATQLSGGEMQRVAIGRALVREPSVYLMDEPLSSLDAKLRGELRIELKRIQQDLGATLIYVTHDQTEAMTMATHIGVLNEGRLVQFGTPREIYEDPDDTYVATRLGQPRINLAPHQLFPIHAPAGTTQIGLRTEHVVPGGAGPEGRVTRVEHLGDQTRLHLDVAGTQIVTLTDPYATPSVGQSMRIGVRNPLFFDASGRRLRVQQTEVA